MTPTLIRRTATVLAAAAASLLVAGPASAEIPEGWSDPEEVGLLDVLLVIGAIPILIALLIALAVYGPAMRRGERLAPGADTPDQWFGGPREGTAELESAGQGGTTGGASGSW